MHYSPKNRHDCKLGIDIIKSCFVPLRPERYCLDVLLRRLRKIIILDLNDNKCKNFFSNSKSMRFEFKRHLSSPYRYIIHPFSKANGLMEVVFLLLMLYRYTLLGIKYGEEFVRMDLVANVLWFFFMLSIFFTGNVNYHTKEICIHPKAIALHYLKTYLIFDSILMLKTPLRIVTSTNKMFHATLIILAIISFFVRFRTILFTLDNVLLYFGANKLTTFFVYEILKLAYFLHLVTCVFIVIPEHLNPDNPFLWLYGTHQRILSRSETYCKSFLVVVCYFFGADYDMDTVDPFQNLVLFLLSFVGRLYTLELIARVLGVFGITNISDSKYEQHLIVLRTFLRSLQLPEKLRHRILAGFQKQSRKQYFDEKEIKSHLTDHLKTELFLYGAKSLIEKHSILNKIPRADLLGLLTIMESKMFFSNDVIVLSGDAIEYAYFISSGTVAGYDDQGDELVHLEEGDEFGIAWIAFNDLETNLMTWVALETTEVYCVTRENLSRYFSSQHEVAKYFVEKVRDKFRKYYSSEGKWRRAHEDILLSLKRGRVLERQRLRLFHMD